MKASELKGSGYAAAEHLGPRSFLFWKIYVYIYIRVYVYIYIYDKGVGKYRHHGHVGRFRMCRLCFMMIPSFFQYCDTAIWYVLMYCLINCKPTHQAQKRHHLVTSGREFLTINLWWFNFQWISMWRSANNSMHVYAFTYSTPFCTTHLLINIYAKKQAFNIGSFWGINMLRFFCKGHNPDTQCMVYLPTWMVNFYGTCYM